MVFFFIIEFQHRGQNDCLLSDVDTLPDHDGALPTKNGALLAINGALRPVIVLMAPMDDVIVFPFKCNYFVPRDSIYGRKCAFNGGRADTSAKMSVQQKQKPQRALEIRMVLGAPGTKLV